jgi:hypothetical protein
MYLCDNQDGPDQPGLALFLNRYSLSTRKEILYDAAHIRTACFKRDPNHARRFWPYSSMCHNRILSLANSHLDYLFD